MNTSKTATKRVDILHDLFHSLKYTDSLSARSYLERAKQILDTVEAPEKSGANLIAFGDLMRIQTKSDSALFFYQKAFSLGKSIDNKQLMSSALNWMGNTHLQKGNIEKALEFQQKNVELVTKSGDSLGLASSFNNLGNIYNDLGEYSTAMEYYIKSSEIYKHKGKLESYATTLANIGQISLKLENYKIAEKYFRDSDSLFIITNYPNGRAFVQKNLAIVLKNLGKYEESIRYNLEALDFYTSSGQKYWVSEVVHVIGNTYSEQGRYEEALPYYIKSVEMSTENNDSLSIASANKELGSCYLKLNKLQNAKAVLDKALQISKAVGAPLTTMDSYGELAQLNKTLGNYKIAFEYENQYNQIRDSLYTKEKRDLALEIEAKYQNEQNEKQIKILEAENEINALQLQKRINERNGIIMLAVMVLLIAGLLYNMYRLKQKANHKLKELDQLKSHFFANISHEFRTPLTLIKGPIDQFQRKPEEGLSLDNAQMIHRNADRLLTLVNQLLDLSKIDAGTLKLEPIEGDVFNCIRGAAISFDSLAVRRNIDYQVTVPKKQLWASFDRDKLEKIVYNLLSNAFKFSPEGAWIGCTASFHDGELRIQIEDSGIGISKKDGPHVFERFYQVDGGTTREDYGSGIGLSLTKDLVSLLNGSISLESIAGQGSTFTVILPIKKLPNSKFNSTIDNITVKTFSSEMEKTPIIDTRSVPLILVVEDNLDMCTFISEMLHPKFRILQAKNGVEGLELAMNESPDLIVSDLMMPKMDGLELCERLKTDLPTSHIPIIMLTAKASIENKIEGLETGADDYLVKPFEPEELIVRCKNLIGQRAKLRELYQAHKTGIDPKSITVNSLDEKFLQNLFEVLETHFHDSQFGVPQIQRELAISKTQLHRKTKALTNEAPGEMLRNFRLKRAAQLLAMDADNVTQIAYSVGFNNLSYFAKCFKDFFGVSPSSYQHSS